MCVDWDGARRGKASSYIDKTEKLSQVIKGFFPQQEEHEHRALLVVEKRRRRSRIEAQNPRAIVSL